ncbi:RHS repeat-associated core domain-containing protein [Paenarthrobacter nitroguajacolicus]|uniref:RHS repeat-associated core domain-containing protein n=1 Tax=Paenarthrobacter nitroguajacolicus TaxID=211146 RepID=UPI003ADF3055
MTGFTYDDLDRILEKSVTPAGGTAMVLERSVYDTDTAKGKGQLSSSTRYNAPGLGQPVVTAVSGYNAAYQPSTTTVTLPSELGAYAGTYATTRLFTSTGQIRQEKLPVVGAMPAETLTYAYDDFDNQGSLWNEKSDRYAASTQRSHLDRITSFQQFDNNTTGTGNTTGTNENFFTWAATTGRLTDQWSTNITRNVISDLGKTRYTYNQAGKITARELAFTSRPSTATDYQCYTYDHASRLAAVWTPAPSASTNCASAPSSASTNVPGLGGAAPYAQTYTYTQAGDRSQVKRFDATGALAVTENYTYPAAGAAGPHRVQQIVSTPAIGTPTTQAFTWDAAGRLTDRADQTLTYTLDGRLDTTTGVSKVPANPNPGAGTGTPASVTPAVASTAGKRYYDSAGNLVGIKDGTGTTVTLGTVTAHTSSATTPVSTATCTYSFAGKNVAQRTATAAGTKLTFIVGDTVNTTQTMTMPTTGTGPITTLTRYTDPVGLARRANATGTANNTYSAAPGTTAGAGSNAANPGGFGAANGYISGLDDTVSTLTHLGARELDPVTGIFTAPDPILNTEDQRGFTPYTYAFGNVINASDPSGLQIIRAETIDGSASAPCGCYKNAREEQNNPGRVASPAVPLVRSVPAPPPGNLWDDADMGAIGGFPSMQQADKTGIRFTAEGIGTAVGVVAGIGICFFTALIGCIAGGTVVGAALSTGGWAIDKDGDFTPEELALHAGTDLAVGAIGGKIPGVSGAIKGATGSTVLRTAEEAADAALAAGRTGGAAAELHVAGQVITDVSTGGAKRVLNPLVQEAVDAVPKKLQMGWHGACAELGCLSQAVDANLDLNNSWIRAVAIGGSRPGHGLPKVVCSGCRNVMDQFGVRY